MNHNHGILDQRSDDDEEPPVDQEYRAVQRDCNQMPITLVSNVPYRGYREQPGGRRSTHPGMSIPSLPYTTLTALQHNNNRQLVNQSGGYEEPPMDQEYRVLESGWNQMPITPVSSAPYSGYREYPVTRFSAHPGISEPSSSHLQRQHENWLNRTSLLPG